MLEHWNHKYPWHHQPSPIRHIGWCGFAGKRIRKKKASPFRRSIMAHFSVTVSGPRSSPAEWPSARVRAAPSRACISSVHHGAVSGTRENQNDLWEVRFCGYDEVLMFGSAWMTNQIRDVMWDSNTNGLLRIACLIQVLTDTTWYNSSSTDHRSPGLGWEDECLGTWKFQTTPPSGISFMMYLWFISPHEMEQIQVLICFDTESPQFSPYFEPFFFPAYPLVNIQRKLWKITIFHG